MNRSVLKALADYCVGTAESEDGLGCIDKIYVESSVVEEILGMRQGSPRILVGHKGNGKTLILTELRNRLASKGIQVLYLTPSDVLDGKSPTGEEPAVLKDFYFKALVSRITASLGSKLNGCVFGSDTVLLSEALSVGEKRPDFVEKCLHALSVIGAVAQNNPSISQIEGFVHPSTTCKQKVDAVNSNLQKKENVFYVFIDEPDEVGTDGSATPRVWGLLNACRELTRRLKNIRCVVALRSEMWNLMIHSPSGGKNIDHFKPLIVAIDPSKEEIESIIDRRLSFVAQMEDVLRKLESVYDVFFTGASVDLPPPAQDERRTWRDYLVKSSRERPRDVIQFIRELAISAYTSRRDKISSEDVLVCAPRFSRHLMELLIKEYEVDFPSAKTVYQAFAGHPFAIPAEDVLKILRNIIGANHVVVRGVTLNRIQSTHVFLLWRMLHETGFLNPYVADDRMRKGYRHISFQDEDSLIADSNYEMMKRYTWEIHPAYKSYLYSLSEDEVHRISVMKQKRQYRQNANYYEKRSFRQKTGRW